MKKLLLLLFAALFVFQGCSKDDDGLSGDEGKLVGAWKLSGGSSVWAFLENGTCYSPDGYVGTWRYYVPSSTGGDYRGFLTTEYYSTSGKGYTSNWWVVSVSSDKWIATNVSGEDMYTYSRIEFDNEKYKPVDQNPAPSKSDEGIKITLSYSKNTSTNSYTCMVKLSGDVNSEDVSEIGVRFAPANSDEEPFFLFANPGKEKLSYSTSRTLSISEKVMGYAIVKGKTYKTNIQTIKISNSN